MSKRDQYREKLRTLEDWDAYLMKESGLPGPRGNLELAQAADQDGAQYWSDAANEGTVPGCARSGDHHPAPDRDGAGHERRDGGRLAGLRSLSSVSVPGRAGLHHREREFAHKEKTPSTNGFAKSLAVRVYLKWHPCQKGKGGR